MAIEINAGRDAELRLEGHGLLIDEGILEEFVVHRFERIAIHSVCADFGQRRRKYLRPGTTRVVGAGVPRIVREQDFDAILMKIRNHLFDSVRETGHVADQLVLVSTVYTHVRISW